MKKFLDRNDPFFRALWVRIATVAAPAAMALLELATQSPGWAAFFAAIALWSAWELFLRA